MLESGRWGSMGPPKTLLLRGAVLILSKRGGDARQEGNPGGLESKSCKSSYKSDGQLGIPQVADFREPGIKANASGKIWDMVTCFSLVTLLCNSSPML